MKGKQIWSYQEDQYLKILVFSDQKQINWADIAQKLNTEFPNKDRSSKQCRERYINHCSLSLGASLTKIWTQEQNNHLFQLFNKYGSRWTKISQQMKGKSQNCVKNRFYGSLRKALRKLNRASKNLIKKFKKQVKYQSITRIIDASQGLFRLQSPLKEESQYLSRKLIDLAKKSQEQMPASQAQQLIIQINKFNMATRSYKSKKKSKIENGSSKKNNYLQKPLLKQSNRFFEEGNENQMEIGNSKDTQQLGSSTNQQNVQFSKIIPQKRPQKIQGEIDELRDLYLDQQFNLRNQSLLSIQDFFIEAHSPLQFEAWI